MPAAALMYHDVTPAGREDSSGFAGGDAARYKLTPDRFAAHLSAIAARGVVPLFTFDDGGVSAVDPIAAALEQRGWRGFFFITTARIGQPGFTDARQLRDLRGRGHVIGSHSHTHPLRMADCARERLVDEWSRSTAILTDLLGEPIDTASVPGGHHSMAVFETAAAEGITTLFTSEPTRRVRAVGEMSIVGRYAMRASTPPEAAARLSAGDLAARVRWSGSWIALGALKKVAGPAYLKLRARLLGASPDMQFGDQH